MASEYHRGEMDIHEQQATFSLVMGMTKWGSLATAVSILALTIWFCTDAGFMAGAIAAIVTTVAGVLLLRDGKASAH